MKKTILLAMSLLGLGSAHAATVPSRYLDTNITRPYYIDELEHCPGILEMRAGDLWTLTFPDAVQDSFITREGVIERQVVGNRLVMAAVGSSGNTPVLVMTSDNKAPRFRVEIKSGEGGGNKNIMILPGLPPGGSNCPGSQQFMSSGAGQPSSVMASAPSKQGSPAATTGVSPLFYVADENGATAKKAEGRVQAATPSYLQVFFERQGADLNITLNNLLDADLALDARDLRIGSVNTTLDRFYLLPAGSSLNITVPSAAQGNVSWNGTVIGSGETFQVTGQQ